MLKSNSLGENVLICKQKENSQVQLGSSIKYLYIDLIFVVISKPFSIQTETFKETDTVMGSVHC